MIPSLISLVFFPFTPQGVYCEIYPSLGGNIETVKSQYSIFYNDILYCTVLYCIILLHYIPISYTVLIYSTARQNETVNEISDRSVQQAGHSGFIQRFRSAPPDQGNSQEQNKLLDYSNEVWIKHCTMFLDQLWPCTVSS